MAKQTKRENKYLRTYKITHIEGDPNIVNDTLELGNQQCMGKMRPHLKKGDWVVAQLGKTFYSPKLKYKYDWEKKYLAYAMKVSSTKFKRIDGKKTKIIYSRKGNYYCFSEKYPLISHQFYQLFAKPKARAHKHTPLETPLCQKFIAKIKSMKKSNNHLRQWVCKKSATCVKSC